VTRHSYTIDFLRETLAGGPVGVPELEAMARAAGLLGGRQQIRYAKTFRKAKKDLGIVSVRDGFGVEGKWSWRLPTKDMPLPAQPASAPDETVPKQVHDPICAADHAEKASTKPQIPASWVEGVARLDDQPAPSDVRLPRWHLFLADCHRFMSSPENWAERAASFGWDAMALFGCSRIRPIDHMGSAGLLWAINGGRLVELHCDWAVIERAADRSRQVYHRRQLHAANVTLPWIGLRRHLAE
jgi:hypothetical protein